MDSALFYTEPTAIQWTADFVLHDAGYIVYDMHCLKYIVI